MRGHTDPTSYARIYKNEVNVYFVTSVVGIQIGENF